MGEQDSVSSDQLIRENEELRAKLTEAQDVIRAIQTGDVDAVVVSGPGGDQVFTLKGAEYAYRALVESMNEGAATLGADGTVLYCNQRLSDLLGIPLEQIIGSPVMKLAASEAKRDFEALLVQAWNGEASKPELEFRGSQGNRVPVYVSLRKMRSEDAALSMVVADLTERKKREELIAAGKLATSILESAAEAIAVCAEDGKIIHANQALEELCNCNPLFQSFAVALPLQDGDGAADNSISDALSGSTIRSREVSLRRSDGQSISLLLTAAPIQSSSGVLGCVVNLTDITERKLAQDKLRRQADLLRLSHDAIIVWRIDGGIESWNLGAERLYGYSEQEALGRVTHELLKTIRQDPLSEVLRKLHEGGNWEGELHHTTKDGREVIVSSRHQLIVGADGAELLLETNRDITGHKRAENELRVSEARFRAFFETAAAGTAEMDMNGRFLQVNHRFCQITGYRPEELLVMRAWDLTHPEDRVAEQKKLEQFLRGNSPIYTAEKRYVRKDGSVIWVQVSAAMIRDAKGRPLRSAGVIQDITEHKQAEQALLRSEKLASVGRMASSIAHEINNPLEAVGNTIYLAMNDPGITSEAKSYLEVAVQELDRVNHITRQTLSFHHETTTQTPVDLSKSIDDVLKLYAPRLKSRKITVKRHCPEVGKIKAFGGEIQQVISNLLSNSMDATPEHGRIQFRLSRISTNGTGKIRLTIADTGLGIPPDKLAKIFEPFFTTKEMHGTGLGLWVTKQIIEKHGATIRVRSKLKAGTVFSIVFPVAEVAQES